jgi:hypothetical protein
LKFDNQREGIALPLTKLLGGDRVNWLQEIKERLEKATPGPWFVSEDGFSRKGEKTPTVYAADNELRYIAKCNDGLNINPTPNLSNAEFIAHAPEDIRRLLEEVERLKEAIGEIDDIVRDKSYSDSEAFERILKITPSID